MYKVYISLPISNFEDTVYDRSNNSKSQLKKLGYEPVSPIDVNGITTSDLIDHTVLKKTAKYMGKDIEDVILCDAIYLCEGWENSRGCNIEKYVAEKFGKKILEQKYIDNYIQTV